VSRLRAFLRHAVLQVRTFRRPYRGVMHALIFWGVLVSIGGHIINLLQHPMFVPFVELGFPRGGGYLLFEFVTDAAGAALLAGVAMAVWRRYVTRPPALESRWEDALILAMLALAAIVGFISEAYRLIATAPDWAGAMPVAALLAGGLRAAGVTAEHAAQGYEIILYAHALLGLGLTAAVPYTKLRHIFTAPLNVLVKAKAPPGEMPPIEDLHAADVHRLGAGEVGDFTPGQLLAFDACMRCGRCTEVCPPWLSGQPFDPMEDVVQCTRESMYAAWVTEQHAPLSGNLWPCTTCGACFEACPALVNPLAAVLELRRHRALVTGKMPHGIANTLRTIERHGNPFGAPAGERLTWAEGLNVPAAEAGRSVDVLLWVGCAAAFDARGQRAARALVRLLHAAGVDFAVLGEAEQCCGDHARRMGNEWLWQTLARTNIETLSQYNFNRIVTLCPHGLHALGTEYRQIGGNFAVTHHTTYLAELLWAGRLTLSPAAPQPGTTITSYHDPCYLGRYHGEYGAPRALLDAAGAHRIEMNDRERDSICCGAGGGGMWLELPQEQRPGRRRAGQAREAGAEAICTACPYCLMMLDAESDGLPVRDVAEVLAGALDA
jgi:Fe-S oxidoreductase/nitrate reductase gamma subunit